MTGSHEGQDISLRGKATNAQANLITRHRRHGDGAGENGETGCPVQEGIAEGARTAWELGGGSGA